MLLLLSTLAALAQEPAAAPDARPVQEPATPPGEEMVIRAEESLTLARARLEQAIMGMGYRRSVHRGDRTVFPRTAVWRTKVVLFDDGRMELRTPGLVPMAGAPWWELNDFGQVEAGGLDWGGVANGKRSRTSQESRIVATTSDALVAWRDALWERHLAERRAVRVEEVRVAWFQGQAPDGRVLSAPSERRAWLLESWLHTADSPAGQAVRADLQVFFEDVVQRSEAPFTPAEVAATNQRRAFAQPLELGG